jgi:DNA invertase Pin-like site-specific DNA recombinase
MLIGYARVSTDEQNLDLQIDALRGSGVDTESHLYMEKASGKNDDREALAACLKALRKGDTLVIWKLDRLGRNLEHLIHVVKELSDRGIGLKTLDGHVFDTSSAGGELIFTIFAAMAQFERKVIRERTMAGLQAARDRGRVGGRKQSFNATTLKAVQTAMKERGTSIAQLAKDMNVSKMTVYRYVTPAGELTEKGIALMNKGKKKAA